MGITKEAATGNRNQSAPRHTKEDISDLRRLWDEGHPASVIGRLRGMSREAVLGVAHRNDFPERLSPTARRRRVEAVLTDWLAFLPRALIARRHRLTARQVSDMAHRHNFPKRKR